ncbi:MAG: DUF2541 family protein [bacterium]|nr:DUF2541 family protein [bacterium]MCP5068739.1 DUF2541 family protein [bacterium]
MRANLRLVPLFGLVALMACASPVRAEQGVRLGAVRLADSKDRDILQLGPCKSSPNQRVRELRLVVREHPAEIDRLRVTFRNGDSQKLHVKAHFSAGDTSRWMDLDGDRRCIQKIKIVGDTDSPGWRPGKQARIAFFGR